MCKRDDSLEKSPDCSVCSSTQGALHTCKPKGRVTKMVTVGCGFQATICGGNKSNCVCSLPKPSVVETRHIPYGTTTKNKMCIKKNIKNELILEKAGPRVPSQRLGVETVWILDKPAVHHRAKLIFIHMYNLQLPCSLKCNVGTVTRSWSTCGEPTQRQEEHAMAYQLVAATKVIKLNC